jgi:hypothetical protein
MRAIRFWLADTSWPRRWRDADNVHRTFGRTVSNLDSASLRRKQRNHAVFNLAVFVDNTAG